MENPLLTLLQKQNITAQLYGLPGTYKTTFLVQIIHKRLKEGFNSIYLIDTSNNFPIVRLRPIKHLLQKMIVFGFFLCLAILCRVKDKKKWW